MAATKYADYEIVYGLISVKVQQSKAKRVNSAF
jgi:hypothetical protein